MREHRETRQRTEWLKSGKETQVEKLLWIRDFFPFLIRIIDSNRIFEIDTKYRTKLIRMKLKRKESAKNKKKKKIFS